MQIATRIAGTPCVIGAGIEIRASTLGTEAGYGAYVTEAVHVGNVVTVYDGWLIPRSEVPRPGEPRDLDVWRYCMAVKTTNYVVLGLRVPIIGRGAGSFINHCKHQQNVVAKTVPNSFNWDYFGNAAVVPSVDRAGRLPVLCMVAMRHIFAGEELFFKYPDGSCSWMGINVDSIPPSLQEDTMTHQCEFHLDKSRFERS